MSSRQIKFRIQGTGLMLSSRILPACISVFFLKYLYAFLVASIVSYHTVCRSFVTEPKRPVSFYALFYIGSSCSDVSWFRADSDKIIVVCLCCCYFASEGVPYAIAQKSRQYWQNAASQRILNRSITVSGYFLLLKFDGDKVD